MSSRPKTRPISPKWWFSKGNPLISGKSRFVKYYNLARIVTRILVVTSTVASWQAQLWGTSLQSYWINRRTAKRRKARQVWPRLLPSAPELHKEPLLWSKILMNYPDEVICYQAFDACSKTCARPYPIIAAWAWRWRWCTAAQGWSLTSRRGAETNAEWPGCVGKSRSNLESSEDHKQEDMLDIEKLS